MTGLANSWYAGVAKLVGPCALQLIRVESSVGRRLGEAGGFASRWKEIEVIAFPDDDELKAPKLDVGSQSKVDVISSHQRLGGVERDAQRHLPGAPTIGVLEPGVPRMGQVNYTARRSLQWLCKSDTRCILVRDERPYV
jgi:hypothetical protein